jgi:hypothetical protein
MMMVAMMMKMVAMMMHDGDHVYDGDIYVNDDDGV